MLKGRGADIQTSCRKETIKGKKLMFIEHFLCSSNCDMYQRDINGCGPSPEGAQGLVGQAAESQLPLTAIQVRGHQGAAVPMSSPEAAGGCDDG